MKILFAHNSVNLVKKGDKVKKGDYIGEIGNANGKWIAHLHLSASEGLSIGEIKSYIINWKKSKVEKYYQNPKDLFSGKDLFDVPIDEGNAGYDWLQWIGNGYHNGVDYNGLGGGNTDYGYKIKTPFDGEIIESSDWKGGWGKCVVLQVNNSMKKKNQEFYDSKSKGQGWTTLEDWVDGAREYRKERDEALEKIAESEDELEDADVVVDSLTKQRDEALSKTDKLTGQYRKLVKSQNELNKAHDLELSRTKTKLTTEYNQKLSDLEEKLVVCEKLKEGAIEMLEDTDFKETFKRQEEIITDLTTEVNGLDIEIAKLKSSENIIKNALRIISNYLKKWIK